MIDIQFVLCRTKRKALAEWLQLQTRDVKSIDDASKSSSKPIVTRGQHHKNKGSADYDSDPICYNTQDGQGIGGLNMAACYSCSLIPENACEEFNSFLDRSFLIDHKYGFFRGL